MKYDTTDTGFSGLFWCSSAEFQLLRVCATFDGPNMINLQKISKQSELTGAWKIRRAADSVLEGRYGTE